MRMYKKGSITVFLSLLLPLLLALIGTLLEAARVHSVRGFLPELTRQSMQMMFSDYNKELWEDYGLFAYTRQEKEAVEEITRAVEAALNPGQKKSGEKAEGLDLWQAELSELSMVSKEVLTDEDGELLKHEAVEVMKYRMTEEAMEKVLKLLHAVKETGAAAHVAEKKLEAEEQMYAYSQEMLDFIELIDGVDFGENGVEYSGGKLKIKPSFVKQFSYGTAERGSIGIRDEQVWEALEGNFYDAKESLELLDKILGNLKKEFVKEEEGKQRLEQLKQELEVILAEPESVEEPEKTEKKEEADEEEMEEEYRDQLINNRKRRKKIEDEITKLQNELADFEKRKKQLVVQWKEESEMMIEKVGQLEICTREARDKIPELSRLQASAAESVQKYQKTLEKKKDEVSGEMYQSFSEDCEEMASSVGIRTEKKKQAVCDLDVFDRYLQENIKILQNIKSGVVFDRTDNSVSGIETKERELSVLMGMAAAYHRSEFIFTYHITEKRKRQKNPIDTLKKFGNTSLLSLLVKDVNKLSKNSIPGEERVFQKEGEEGFLENISGDVLKVSAKEQGVFSSIFGGFSSASDKVEVSDSVKQIGQEFCMELLLNGYVQEMFSDYVSEAENDKISVLRYEQEYILSGQESDKDNLASVVKKLAAVRTVCSFLALLTDSARQKEAYAAAAAIAGITGIEPLTEVLKSAILLVWAYEDAVIDTAVLLQGKKIPAVKTPSQISLSFQELFSFGRTMVQKKAEGYKEIKNGCSYSEYLYLFFCIQKQKNVIYRMADMIQFNMQKRYGEEFLLENAVFGCKIKGSYHLPWVFFRLPFTGWVAGGQAEGWKLEVIAENAY